jgi:serine/threonine protein kinase
LQKFDNPFVIKLYEAFEENDRFYLATEYANGGSLKNLMETYPNKKIPMDEAIQFFSMMCLGLNYIHT